MKTSRNKKDTNQIRIENEVKKIKLKFEHNMDFNSSASKISEDLPPEVEGQFLDYVQNFEDSWKNAKRAKVYDLLGKPAYTQVNDILDSEIRKELDKM